MIGGVGGNGSVIPKWLCDEEYVVCSSVVVRQCGTNVRCW